jgi:hypothetical protein
MAIAPAIYQTSTNEAFLWLLTITTSNETIRLVNNMEDVVSRGDNYTAYPFNISLPVEDGSKQLSLSLTIDNVDQVLIEAIRGFLEPPVMKLELVLSSDFDTVEKKIDFLRLGQVEYDQLQIRGQLKPNNVLGNAFPATSYDPAQFPALFY